MMRRFNRIVGLLTLVVAIGLPALPAPAESPAAAQELAGLWRAKRHFGPEVRGALTIERSAGAWTAQIAGQTAQAAIDHDRLSFELPDGEGAFRGRLKSGRIIGHWIQPRTVASGNTYASPVTLEQLRRDRWRGVVTPLDDEMTFYMPIKLNEDGTLGAFLRNPERNVGVFFRVEHVTLDGSSVKLLGRRSKDAPETVVAEGTYDADNEILSIYLPSGGGTFDFRRATASDEAGFYPRGKTPAPYAYRSPPSDKDGWPVATLKEVGISRDGISRFVQMLIDTPIESVHSSDIHGVLLARHGKLVLEEYFHGFNRDWLHDTRSAAKSLTSVLTGAASLKGEPIDASTSVYETMDGATALSDLDSRKRAMTVENLLTMSSGLDCDDSDSASPGNEDTMQEQSEQPDWYRYTMDLKMVRAPGEKSVYCSCNPNLIGGVLARATGRWLPELFHDLLVEPLQIRSYAMNLTPTGDAYMGGGIRLLPRDFMKLGQIMIDQGRWHGSKILSRDWARRSVSPLVELGGKQYGYLWWVMEYPYKDRTVRAFFAGGNGGQVVMGIPELDLVIAFYGGNYSDSVFLVPQRVYVPEYILPAVN